MAYRYTPVSDAKLNEQMAPSFKSVMNFNIPPPGFGPSCSNEEPKDDFDFRRYPPPCVSEEPKNDCHFSLHPPSFTNEKPQRDTHLQNYPPHPSQQHFDDSIVTQPAGRIPNLLQCVQEHQKIKTRRVKKNTSCSLKVYEARQLLQLCLKNLEELQGLHKTLKLDYHNLNSALWKVKCDHISDLRVQIDASLRKLDNSSTIETLKKVLTKRNKKRKREKQKRADHREIMAESRTRREQLHESINNWLKNMQDVVEKAKREESLKHEADQVLSEVTRRKTEARKQLNMLKGLQKLRRIRAQTLTNQGQRLNVENGIRFARVVEHLVKLWEDQLKEYEIEEQGLRVMLEEAVEERNKYEVIQIKQSLQQWEELLFGKRGPFNEFFQAAERDEEAFIAVRKSWDQFLTPAGAVMSSSIPVGWVIPATPSSSEWESHLTKN